MDRNSSRKALRERVGFLIAVGLSAKIVVDTTVQLFNPFLTIIAAGIGISAIGMGRLVALRGMMGLAAPLFGSLADRVGYRAVMRCSLLTGGAGMILFALTDNICIFALSMVITGLGQSGYTPNLHAYLSSRLPYEKRARGLGIVEYAWALAGIVGLFFTGYLIELYGWKAPFFVLGGALIGFSLFLGTLPAAGGTGKRVETAGPRAGLAVRLRDFFTLGEHNGSAWATIVINALNFFAISHILIIHGGWLEKEYGLGAASLGKVALFLGLFDWAASIVVSVAVDSIGKKRSVGIGIAGTIIGYALFPFLNRSLPLALFALALPRAFFEFATVSNFPLMSEQSPLHRGKVLSLSMTFGLIGSTIASATGPWAYLRFGVWGLGPVSLAASVTGMALLLLVVKERPHGITEPPVFPPEESGR